MEDRGHKLDMHDASRYSHESSVSLLHSYHRQTDSTPEPEHAALSKQGRSKVLHSQSGLLQLVTEEPLASHHECKDLELQHGGTIYGQSRQNPDDAASGTADSPGSPAVFSGQLSLARPRDLIAISVISHTVANRGLFMIAASQAAFASMNALVSVMHTQTLRY